MRYFRNAGILVLGAIIPLAAIKLDSSLIFIILESIILICGNYFLEKKNIKLVLYVLSAALVTVIPEAVLLCPVLLYIFLREEQVLYIALSGLTGILMSSKAGIYFPQMTGNFWLVNGIAVVMSFDDIKYNKMYFENRKIKDDSEERTLLLAEKNKALQEKQNYEIYAATLRERNRIAREIHDNVGHLLSRTILLTGAAKAVNQDRNLDNLLEGLDTSLNSAMNSIRLSVHDLHDESMNLEETIKSVISDFKNCELIYDMSDIIPDDIKYCFTAITKEALTNIIKYSNATSVKLTLREHPSLYQLYIEDNGKGYDSKDGDRTGIGLKNMRDRVQSLGGTLRISGENGFRIFAAIPKKQE